MSLSFEEIITTKYPNEIKSGLIILKEENDGNGVVIAEWNINEPQPDYDTVMGWGDEVIISQFNLNKQVNLYSENLQYHIDYKAREKSYENGVSCASYFNSTNLTWAAEALQFITWRDSCWKYAYDIKSQVEQGQISTPSLDEFIAGVPALNW